MKKEKFVLCGAAAGGCTGLAMEYLRAGGYLAVWNTWMRAALAGLVAWAIYSLLRELTLYIRGRKTPAAGSGYAQEIK
jgi:hypothetical protein